jgi:hypothetical protein
VLGNREPLYKRCIDVEVARPSEIVKVRGAIGSRHRFREVGDLGGGEVIDARSQ